MFFILQEQLPMDFASFLRCFCGVYRDIRANNAKLQGCFEDFYYEIFKTANFLFHKNTASRNIPE